MAKRRCLYCKQYSDKETSISFGLSAFCSEEHKDLWRTDNSDRSVSRAQKTTSIRRKARKNKDETLTEVARAEVFAVDSGRCRGCGKVGHDFECHHVYYRSEAAREPWLNSRHNLLTLCTECHTLVHSNKKLYQPLALQVVYMREVYSDTAITIRELERQINNK